MPAVLIRNRIDRLSPIDRSPANRHRYQRPPRAALDQVVPGMPRAAGPRIDAYLDVSEMTLDGFLAEHEKRALVAVPREQGLSRGQVIDVPGDYLRAMAEVAWADGVVAPKERADLELVAGLLDLPTAGVDSALDAAQADAGTTAPARSRASLRLHLRR